MSSRCSGSILNCPNHRKTAFFAAYSSIAVFLLPAFQTHPRPSLPHPSLQNVLSWDVSSLEVLSSNFPVNITTTPPSSEKKGKPRKKATYIHISHSHCHPQPKKKLSIHLYYILIPEQPTNQHVSCNNTHFTDCFQLETPHHLSIFFFLLPNNSNCCYFVSHCISAFLFFRFYFLHFVYT